MARRRKGKSVRASRAGVAGEGKRRKLKFKGQFASRDEQRALESEERREVQKLRENAAAAVGAQEAARQPHSFVIHRGEIGRYATRLEHDIRQVMEPNTASKLRVMKRNNLRDFVVNGTPLGVTHLAVFTRSENSLNLRLIRAPQGPTLTFKVKEFTPSRNVLSSQKRPVIYQELYRHPPLLILNGFNDSTRKHLQLVQTMLQNMFPTINIDKLKLSNVKRCLLVSYNKEMDVIYWRHYAIKAVPTGLSKSTKKLVQSKVPDLSKYKDISDYFLNPGQLSESEFEGEQKEVELGQDLRQRGLLKGQKSNVRLVEIGPRMSLHLRKVEEGIDDGEVLYHAYVKKTAQELVEQRKTLPLKKKLKERRLRANEHRVIHRLTVIAEREAKVREEEKALREKAARKQAEVTGQTDEVDTDKQKDREIAMQRQRDEKKTVKGGGEGQNRPAETRKRRKDKKEDDNGIGSRKKPKVVVKKTRKH